MSAMGQIEAQEIQWYAMRLAMPKNKGRRTAIMGGEFEAYRDRKGRVRKRRVAKTGTRVFVAEHLLREAGFEVFLPVRKKVQRVSRVSRETELVAYPLLADWVFVGWPVGQDRWWDIERIGAVLAVLGAGGRPIRFPERRILELMAQWGNGVLEAGNHKYIRQRANFVVGGVARVIEGPFEGFEFDITEMSGGQAKGFVDIFGRPTELGIPLEGLENIS